MKHILIIFSLALSLICSASPRDSTFQRHQFNVSVTNGMSHLFFNEGGHLVSTHVEEGYTDPFGIYSHVDMKYQPDYYVHLNLTYSLGLSKTFRIESGLGYLLQGYTFQETYWQRDYSGSVRDYLTERGYFYAGYFTVPVHLNIRKELKHGHYTCTLGPSFNFVFNGFGRQTHIVYNGEQLKDRSFVGNTEGMNGMGADMKMGYETKINKKLFMDIGPIISFTNLVRLDDHPGGPIETFYYRIGLDLAFNFSFKK